MIRRCWKILWRKKVILPLLAVVIVVGSVATLLGMRSLPEDLEQAVALTRKNTYLDRSGRPLNVTYENGWNIYDRVRLHDVPELLQQAFLCSEDKRFFSHSGIDWLARLNAVRQNLLAGRVVRGASTISEQVVRMLHPRPRTVWARWLEGFEALALEHRFTKPEILEFYLNQVPYQAKRRGVVQAAHYYFDRDLSTLDGKEMLALAVLVRAPHWFDPQARPANLERAVTDLAGRMFPAGPRDLLEQQLTVKRTASIQDMSHFIRYAEAAQSVSPQPGAAIDTSINLDLQSRIQQILDVRLDRLQARNVHNGAVLVIDHRNNEVLAWVDGYAGKKNKKFNEIDAVTTPRQPGSALKPLLYANAMVKGWTAATMLDDSPLEESVGLGMHTYHNYSRDHYGPISLREALGNSLNIPAVRAIQYVDPAEFLGFLHRLGVTSLAGHPNVYGDGLALGNGELTLYELVQAYTVLARMGDYKPLTFSADEALHNGSRRVLSEDVASLVADILSDPAAREKEFGRDSILNFPYQTAVKTGTSSDYRDAWAVGFNDRFTVGIWVGNLDYAPMHEVTGSTGAVLALRSVFNELNRNHEPQALYFSPNLVKQQVCIASGLPAVEQCDSRDEWFVPGTTPTGLERATDELRIRKPSNGLLLARDPRIPDDAEYFEFALTDVPGVRKVRWYVNDRLVGESPQITFAWPLRKGTFHTRAEVFLHSAVAPVWTDEVVYTVN